MSQGDCPPDSPFIPVHQADTLCILLFFAAASFHQADTFLIFPYSAVTSHLNGRILVLINGLVYAHVLLGAVKNASSNDHYKDL